MTTTTFDSFLPHGRSVPEWKFDSLNPGVTIGRRTFPVEAEIFEPSGYPRAPELIAQFDRAVLSADPLVDKVDVQLQLEATLPPFELFVPDQETAETFVRNANGSGLDRLSNWLIRAIYTNEDAVDLLAEAIEGGLIATIQYLRRSAETKVVIAVPDEIVLKQAIARRIPKVSAELKKALAQSLVDQLRRALGLGRALQIDGATVNVVDGKFVAQIISPPQRTSTAERNDVYALAA